MPTVEKRGRAMSSLRPGRIVWEIRTRSPEDMAQKTYHISQSGSKSGCGMMASSTKLAGDRMMSSSTKVGDMVTMSSVEPGSSHQDQEEDRQHPCQDKERKMSSLG